MFCVLFSLDFSLEFWNLLLKELDLSALILILRFKPIILGFEPLYLSTLILVLSFEFINLRTELIVLGLKLIDQMVFCLILPFGRDELGIQFSHFILWLFVLNSLLLGIPVSFKQWWNDAKATTSLTWIIASFLWLVNLFDALLWSFFANIWLDHKFGSHLLNLFIILFYLFNLGLFVLNLMG